MKYIQTFGEFINENFQPIFENRGVLGKMKDFLTFLKANRAALNAE